jgi:YD repeat-containing protein
MDHAIEAALHGPTDLANGRFLCVRHHHLRHKGWHLTYDPAARRCSVTSPLGITWTGDGHVTLPGNTHPPPRE